MTPIANVQRQTSLFALAAAVGIAMRVAAVHADPVVLKTTDLGHGPTIVFVHGLGATRNDWLPTARRLVGRYHLVLVDLPGHGDSPPPEPLPFTTGGQALDGALARQNPERTIGPRHP